MSFIFQFNNEVLGGDWGSPEPESFIKNHGYPEGTIWEEVDRPTFIERMKLNERKMGSLTDSPHEQLRKLKLQHEALIEILEDIAEKGIHLTKGDLKKMVAEKIKGANK